MKRIMTDYERVAYKFIPALRQYTASVLVKEMSMSQKNVADLLGITQAAISKYVNNKNISKETIEIMEKFERTYVYEYINKVIAKSGIDAQKSVCKLCQSYHKFDCNIMVK